MNFISIEHKERFEILKRRGRCFDDSSIEKWVVLFIIAGNKELYDKVNELYDFNKEEFIFDIVKDDRENFNIKWKTPLSSSEKNLITLAFDLYSANNNICIYELFAPLDSNNLKLALESIKYRFDGKLEGDFYENKEEK